MDEKKPEERYKPITQHKQEEEYFFKRDQELIRSLREKADAERKRTEREQQRNLHWMRCPKCGGEMVELAVEPLRLDRCRECRGVFFDDGEIEILRQLQLGNDFLAALAAKLRGSS